MSTKFSKGDKVSFRLSDSFGDAIKVGVVTGFTNKKVRVSFSHCGFAHEKLMFERNLTPL